MTEETIIRMHLLQLQQINLLVCLSEKLNLIMERAGMDPKHIAEIKKIERAMIEVGEKQAFSDWTEDIKP